MERNLKLYPWYQFVRALLFWQAIWFLYFEHQFSAAEAVILYAVADLSMVVLEVPSGYLSDAIGRRKTLLVSVSAQIVACVVFAVAGSLTMFVFATILMSASNAFNSGTDNAFLYDTLQAQNRTAEVAAREAHAWRYLYAGLAISAALGGVIAMASMPATYMAGAVTSVIGLVIVIALREPPRLGGEALAALPVDQIRTVGRRLRDPVLFWIFIFAGTSYILSHVPYVFLQPWLREMLATNGMGGHVPVVIGLVIAAMMAMSVGAGHLALPLRRRIGTLSVLLLSLAMQTVLIAAMAWFIHPLLIALALFRMAPSALAHPFVLEAVQPRIESGYRATYLSVQNLAARLVFSAALFAAASAVSSDGTLTQSGLATVLPWFAAGGLALMVGLWWTGRQLLDRQTCVNNP